MSISGIGLQGYDLPEVVKGSVQIALIAHGLRQVFQAFCELWIDFNSATKFRNSSIQVAALVKSNTQIIVRLGGAWTCRHCLPKFGKRIFLIAYLNIEQTQLIVG
ncbi:MAG TPA: hypothetical protein VKZ53_24380 [Candidatus Angelobacter sp.]|nr:hypothetical protein [Candidatus Angelobacter sp.]